MDAKVTYALAMSCLVPALAGIYQYKKIQRTYHPFIYMMILTVVVETIVYFAKDSVFEAYWPLAVNLYTLVNFTLYLYFTKINGYINAGSMRWLFVTAIAVCLFNFMYEKYTVLRPFFYLLCYVSSVMLIISIDILSRQTMAIKYKMANNFWFWHSSFSIIYNAFTLLIFGLYFFAMFNTPKGKAIGTIHHYANLICYVFFAVAIFKIPKRK
jgi:hypothetical protein